MNPLDEYRLQMQRLQLRLESMESMMNSLQSDIQLFKKDLNKAANLSAEAFLVPVPEMAEAVSSETAAKTVPEDCLSESENLREPVFTEISPSLGTPVSSPSATPEHIVPEPTASVASKSEESVPLPTETPQTLGQQFEQTAKPNLQQSLSGNHSSDFLKSLSLNDRFRLTRELFAGDSGAFAEAITVISNAPSSRDAIHYLRQTIHWEENNATVMEFRERIEQFFFQR